VSILDILGFVWTHNSGAGRLFATMILVLGASAAWAALSHRARYRGRESRTLDDVAGRLRRAIEAQQPERAEGEAEEPEPGIRVHQLEPVDLRLLSEKVPPESLIGDRLAAVARLKQARVKVTVEALQQMTVLRESSVFGLAFPAYAVDMCMMLGLLGTFLGLCLMLLQMQGVVPGAGGTGDAGNFAGAATSLGDIIASKKTAFATTLVGLVCAIGVSWLNFLLARAQSAFYDRLERFTAAELLPATVPGLENEQAMEKLSIHLTDAFARLGSITESHGEQMERIEAMQASFGTIVESIRSIMLRAAHAPPEEATGVLTGMVKQLADTNESLLRIAGAVGPGGAGRLSEPYAPQPYRRESSPIGPHTAGVLRRVESTLGVVHRNPGKVLAGVGVAVSLLVVTLW
jgi:hypothetical protein